MMWAATIMLILAIILWIIAISFAASALLFIVGAISHVRMEPEWTAIFGVIGMVMLAFAAGAAYAAMAVRGMIP